jgi:hypothetical protein
MQPARAVLIMIPNAIPKRKADNSRVSRIIRFDFVFAGALQLSFQIRFKTALQSCPSTVTIN